MKIDSFEEYLNDVNHCRKSGCYNFTNNGKCSKCGSCCSTLLPLKESEIKRLRKIIKMRHLKPHEQPKVVMAIDLTCPFLTDDNLCSIYDDRPWICKIFKCDSEPDVEEFKHINEPIDVVNVRDLFN